MKNTHQISKTRGPKKVKYFTNNLKILISSLSDIFNMLNKIKINFTYLFMWITLHFYYTGLEDKQEKNLSGR